MALAGDIKLKNFLALAGGGLALLLVGTCGFGWMMGGTAAQKANEKLPEPEHVAVMPAPVPPTMPTPVPAPEAAPAPAPAEQPAPTGDTSGLSEVEKAVMGFRGKNLGSSKLKDASKGRPYKINVYQDEGNTTANRAKVDLDRDDKWDQKWTFRATDVQRKTAPADDENYTRVEVWTGTAWAPEG